MRKIIFLIFILPLGVSGQSPNPIGKNANLSLFAGYFCKQQNINANGNYWGLYGDLPIWQSPSQLIKINSWAVFSRSSWEDNLSTYQSTTNEVAGGFSAGYYDEFFSLRHSFYGSMSLGYKNAGETGEVSKKNYSQSSHQTDQLLVGGFNFNLMKYSGYTPELLPRTQVVIAWQLPLSAEKTVIENGRQMGQVAPWEKGTREIQIKQSVYDIALDYGHEIFLQPKVGVQYFHYSAGNPDAYSYIIELSLHKASIDDFLSFSLAHKCYPGEDYFLIMMNINLLNL